MGCELKPDFRWPKLFGWLWCVLWDGVVRESRTRCRIGSGAHEKLEYRSNNDVARWRCLAPHELSVLLASDSELAIAGTQTSTGCYWQHVKMTQVVARVLVTRVIEKNIIDDNICVVADSNALMYNHVRIRRDHR